MKKLVSALVIGIMTLACAAKDLRIYAVSGKVSKKTVAGWVMVKKPGSISDADMLKINPESSLKVIDNTTHRVYTFNEPGEALVSRLVDKSQRESASIASRMVAESRRRLSEGKSHQAVGASMRGTSDEELLEALFTALNDGFQAAVNKGDISIEKISDGDGIFHLRIINTGKKELYANVFIHTDQALWEALYKLTGEESSLLIAPGESVEIADIQLSESPDLQLAAVAYDAPFEGEDLSNMFSAHLRPEAPAAQNVNFFFLKN